MTEYNIIQAQKDYSAEPGLHLAYEDAPCLMVVIEATFRTPDNIHEIYIHKVPCGGGGGGREYVSEAIRNVTLNCNGGTPLIEKQGKDMVERGMSEIVKPIYQELYHENKKLTKCIQEPTHQQHTENKEVKDDNKEDLQLYEAYKEDDALQVMVFVKARFWTHDVIHEVDISVRTLINNTVRRYGIITPDKKDEDIIRRGLTKIVTPIYHEMYAIDEREIKDYMFNTNKAEQKE